MKDNILHTQQVTVEITGVSIKSKDDAINNAFHNLRGEVAKIVPQLTVYMRPIEVTVKDIEEYEYTERLFFIFMPRKKARTKIVLGVTVEVSTLNI